ncbi:T-cell surface antigen CD2-like [Crassostrea angulata]|uniref:T-cell surface antigen CD2-like n=1 Tax=Magallana angulata TaxID=2784310 RepID=UPI0022B1E265|nr:T-cell surface antigen CD2-like [Crassostrea angulata]
MITFLIEIIMISEVTPSPQMPGETDEYFEISVTSLVLALLLLLGWVIKTLFRRWARIRRRRRGDTVPKETAMEMERRRQPPPPPQLGPFPRQAVSTVPHPRAGATLHPPRAAPFPAPRVAPTPARGGGRYHLRPAKRPRTE